MNKNKSWLIFFLGLVIGGAFIYFISNSQHNIVSNNPLPNSDSSNTNGNNKEVYNYPLKSIYHEKLNGEYSNKFTCSSIVNNILQSDDGYISKQPGIFAIQNVSITDKFALEIIGNVLILQTDANVKAGNAQGEQMDIESNTSDSLLAVKQDPSYIDVFSLNKATGLAIANITRSTAVTTLINPQSESEYLLCQ